MLCHSHPSVVSRSNFLTTTTVLLRTTLTIAGQISSTIGCTYTNLDTMGFVGYITDPTLDIFINL